MCQLIYCIEPTLEAEDKLVNYLSKLNIQPDIDFFNQLMSKRCSRKNGKKHAMDLFDKIHPVCGSNDVRYTYPKPSDMKPLP